MKTETKRRPKKTLAEELKLLLSYLGAELAQDCDEGASIPQLKRCIKLLEKEIKKCEPKP